MTFCTVADVGQRLGLDSSQRTRANSRILSAIRRAGIDIDQVYADYGREVPTGYTQQTTLGGEITDPRTTSFACVDSSSFDTSGSGNVDGDTFSWTGLSGSNITGVTGLTTTHSAGVIVQQGEFAHVLREICADLAAAYYLEDESMFQTTTTEGSLRSSALKSRGEKSLMRLAHLGSL